MPVANHPLLRFDVSLQARREGNALRAGPPTKSKRNSAESQSREGEFDALLSDTGHLQDPGKIDRRPRVPARAAAGVYSRVGNGSNRGWPLGVDCRESLAIACSSACASMGLARCTWNPAAIARACSSGRA